MATTHTGLVSRLDTGASIEKGLFDKQPIKLDGFRLTARAAVPVGKPTVEQWTAAFAFSCATEEGSKYWVGDLLNYAETRDDWHSMVDQAVSMGAKNYADQTLRNMTYVARRVGPRARALAPSPAHASEVASLEANDQILWLERARSENLTQRDLRSRIKDSKRRTVLDGQADTMHTVDVVVRLSVEAQNTTQAEDKAWTVVKELITARPHTHVISAKAQGAA